MRKRKLPIEEYISNFEKEEEWIDSNLNKTEIQEISKLTKKNKIINSSFEKKTKKSGKDSLLLQDDNLKIKETKKEMENYIKKIPINLVEIIDKSKKKQFELVQQKTHKEENSQKRGSSCDNISSLTIKTQKSSFFSKKSGTLKDKNNSAKVPEKRNISLKIKTNFNFDLTKNDKNIFPKSCTNKKMHQNLELKNSCNISLDCKESLQDPFFSKKSEEYFDTTIFKKNQKNFKK
jgi:hypothetical protein